MIGASAAIAMFWAALSSITSGPVPYNVAVAADAGRVETPAATVASSEDAADAADELQTALSAEQQMIGLMFRTEVKPDEGMLFDWHAPRESAMWMRNTLIPLDMVFIRADGRIHRIAERTVPQSLNTIESRGPVRATLELAGGTTAKQNIRVGDVVQQRIFGNEK